MLDIQTIAISILLVALIVFIVFYLSKGIKKKTKKDKDYIYLSKKGSIVFYVFLLLLLVFFVVMYIKWRIYLNV
ncbi:MAG: hypothetical protein SPK52_06715 [Synergistales bacterium]|nr:hypothetical protein [Bacteroidales bacterium]MDY6394668.1 hypothetical protein [Bacteroidales bacterium]MDY6403209.1 hypothetical protein [Bacteroidales bacterium]MDY6424733.1 hypothetical protein [Bacteroidales bacterium]MDY6435890.1 hypothetical protein [Synergistales bacterium]